MKDRQSRGGKPSLSARRAAKPTTRTAIKRKISAIGAPKKRLVAGVSPSATVARDKRRHPTEDDQRSRFQRDRDRILYTTALRRLAGVTQVAAAGEPHIFHNRLTHTLEIAQISRRIAERLIKDQPEAVEALGGVDADVAEAAALAHDLGHPPFGHIAEKLLDDLMSNEPHFVRDGFEGNAQSFRIVTKLAVRNENDGLDLTRATLNAILKYPVLQTTEAKRVDKWGAYRSEVADFEFARELGIGEIPGVEAEIMDLADDIGYAVHDVEDFFRAGLIPLDRLAQNGGKNEEVDTFFASCESRWKRSDKPPKYPHDELLDAFRSIMELMPIREPFIPDRRQRAKLRTTTATLIADYVRNAKLDPKRDEDDQCVLVGPERRMEIRMLKELTWTYVIENPALATQQHGQRHVISELFHIFTEAAHHDKLAIFPESAREMLVIVGNNPPARLRIVCDLIAGLTEQQAVELFRRLTGVDFGSVLDRLR